MLKKSSLRISWLFKKERKSYLQNLLSKQDEELCLLCYHLYKKRKGSVFCLSIEYF